MSEDTDHEDKRPASRRVSEALLVRIEAGEFGPGDQLPTYRNLADEYGVAVNTALAAVRLLRDAGKVTIRPNAGAQVRDPSGDIDAGTELNSAKVEIRHLRTELQKFDNRLADLEARIAVLADQVDEGAEQGPS